MVHLTFLAMALLSSAAFAQNWFRPAQGATWNIMLDNTPTLKQADDPSYQIWDMDMNDTSKDTIKAFKAKGKKVICYFSAGSWEDWRKDKDQIPKVAIGKVMDGWPSEKWIDTRNEKVRALMKQRISQAQEKGCDGVDPDNIDGYGNDTGFDLTEEDGIDYVKFLARTAHAAGLGYGLKNGGDIVPQVVNASDWEINEECYRYDNECWQYKPFIDHPDKKAVLHIEYPFDQTKKTAQKFMEDACKAKTTVGFSTVFKKLSLDAWTETCHQPQANSGKRQACPPF